MSLWPAALKGQEPDVEALYHTHGDPKLFRLASDWPDLVSDGEECYYVIKVAAVGLTPGELAWPEVSQHEEPIIGYDFSGWVVSAPKNAKCPPGTQV